MESSADTTRQAAIATHWRASETGDAELEHRIYADDAVLEYPQSGERFEGRSAIRRQRGAHPAERHFSPTRIIGRDDLWVSEVIITYDGQPTYSVSVMEFAGDVVTHESQYFADPFEPPAWRQDLASDGTSTTS